MIGERYHVRDILGQGSTGTVFGTVHAHFERAGAMKVLRPRFTSLDTLQRVFHERRARGLQPRPSLALRGLRHRLAPGRRAVLRDGEARGRHAGVAARARAVLDGGRRRPPDAAARGDGGRPRPRAPAPRSAPPEHLPRAPARVPPGAQDPRFRPLAARSAREGAGAVGRAPRRRRRRAITPARCRSPTTSRPNASGASKGSSRRAISSSPPSSSTRRSPARSRSTARRGTRSRATSRRASRIPISVLRPDIPEELAALVMRSLVEQASRTARLRTRDAGRAPGDLRGAEARLDVDARTAIPSSRPRRARSRGGTASRLRRLRVEPNAPLAAARRRLRRRDPHRPEDSSRSPSASTSRRGAAARRRRGLRRSSRADTCDRRRAWTSTSTSTSTSSSEGRRPRGEALTALLGLRRERAQPGRRDGDDAAHAGDPRAHRADDARRPGDPRRGPESAPADPPTWASRPRVTPASSADLRHAYRWWGPYEPHGGVQPVDNR